MTHITDATERMEERIREVISEFTFENPETGPKLAEGIIASARADADDPRYGVDYPTALRTALSRLGETIHFR